MEAEKLQKVDSKDFFKKYSYQVGMRINEEVMILHNRENMDHFMVYNRSTGERLKVNLGDLNA